jgi:hypothetical protein
MAMQYVTEERRKLLFTDTPLNARNERMRKL